MNHKKLLYGGIAVFLVSVLVGVAGSAGSIYGSFDAMEMNESAGIGAVGAGIYRALVFSALGLIGTLVGAGMIIFSAVKLRK